jgi:hypothetical protein
MLKATDEMNRGRLEQNAIAGGDIRPRPVH